MSAILQHAYSWLAAGGWLVALGWAMFFASDLMPHVTNGKVRSFIDLFLKVAGAVGAKPPVAIIVAFSLLAASAPGCKTPFIMDFAACERGDMPGQVSEAIIDVEAALFSHGDWRATLAGLGLKVGTDVVTCAVAAVKAQLSKPATATARGELSPEALQALARASGWLAERGVYSAARVDGGPR